jgi:hypothetical protein
MKYLIITAVVVVIIKIFYFINSQLQLLEYVEIFNILCIMIDVICLVNFILIFIFPTNNK